MRDSRLDRADEKTVVYQMAHCVFPFFWQSDPPECGDERPAWIFWGEITLKCPGVRVSVTLCAGLDVHPQTVDIVILFHSLIKENKK